MKYNTLGASSLSVSEIGLGCMSLSQAPEAEAIKTIEMAIDAGVNFFDTADLYEKGANEELLGKALKGRREDVIIATKVGNRWDPKKEGWYWDPSKEYIKAAVKDSLKRLNTDYIDLYQLHGGLISDPIFEVIDAFNELKQEGLIKEFGISTLRPNVIHRFIDCAAIASIMMQYNMIDRRPEEYFDFFVDYNVSVIARGPLCKGILTDQWRDKFPKLPPDGFLDYSRDEIHELNEKLETLRTEEKGLTQLALQFSLSHPAVATIIPGARNVEQLQEILKVLESPPLTDKEMGLIQEWTKSLLYQQHR